MNDTSLISTTIQASPDHITILFVDDEQNAFQLHVRRNQALTLIDQLLEAVQVSQKTEVSNGGR